MSMFKRFWQWFLSRPIALRVTLIIVYSFLNLVLFLLFLSLLLGAIGQLTYQSSSNARSNDEIPLDIDYDYDFDNEITEEDQEESAEEETFEEVTVENLEFNLTGSPKLVKDTFNLFIEGYIPEQYSIYELGSVKSGLIQETGKELNGLKLYIFVFDYFVDRFVIDGDGLAYRVGEYGQSFEDIFDSEKVIFIKGEFENYWINSNLIDKEEILSDNGNSYGAFAYVDGLVIFDSSKYVKVDSYKGLDIYDPNLRGEFFVKSNDGFAQRIGYIPDIVKDIDGEPFVSVSWNDGSNNSKVYDYISIGGCESNYLEIVDIKKTDLTVAGKSNGKDIYVKKNSANDEYLKKIYQEDYIDAELYTYNDITQDDEKPFTFSQFLADRPVFYWEDPFGRMIMFGRRDYIFTGGCAKPIVYLYPEKRTDLDISVIANGHLTFSYPKLESNTWSVTAFPNGNILYKDSIYNYLWWESVSNGFNTPNEGWTVKRDKVVDLWNVVLKEYGMNDAEILDFITFWEPIVKSEDSEYVFVTFLVNEEVDAIAKLDFSVEPDNILRLFMVYEPLEQYKEVKPLTIDRFNRSGFTVVEWGGAKLK